MKVCIVGHGYSLLSQRLGREIDACDLVIRLKDCRISMAIPWSYGRRIDVHGFSWVARARYLPLFPNAQHWVFPDMRLDDRQWNSLEEGDGCWPDISRKWIKRYQEIISEGGYELQDGQERKGRLSGEHGHIHFSAGMHAIIYACELIKPDEIWIPGFDSLISGKHSKSVIRPADYKKYPDHNWGCEARMLSEVVAYYGVEVNDGNSMG